MPGLIFVQFSEKKFGAVFGTVFGEVFGAVFGTVFGTVFDAGSEDKRGKTLLLKDFNQKAYLRFCFLGAKDTNKEDTKKLNSCYQYFLKTLNIKYGWGKKVLYTVHGYIHGYAHGYILLTVALAGCYLWSLTCFD